MKCPNCSHENEGGKFCEKCGTQLLGNPEAAAAVETTHTQGQNGNSQYFEGAKNVSKQYFSYFWDILKKPYESSVVVGGEQFINAIITIVIYAIIIPLMIYFGLKSLINSFNPFGLMPSPSFTAVVIKPTIAYAVFILLVATFTFGAVRMGKVNANYKEVISRFGSFLIPFVAILVLALVMSLLKIKLFFILLVIGFLGSIFIVPPLVIASFKKQSQGGLDVIYGSLITYILTFIVIGIMSNMLFEAIKSSFSDFFNIF